MVPAAAPLNVCLCPTDWPFGLHPLRGMVYYAATRGNVCGERKID